MALGATLREARMRLGLTPSEIAASTRMKVQMVDGIEREDFSMIAAPIYAKGFIRLFAERVGVDPKPLIEEYVNVFVNRVPTPPSALPAGEPVPVPKLPPEEPPAAAAAREDDLFSRAPSAPPAAEPVGKAPAPRVRAKRPAVGKAVTAALAAAKEACRRVYRRMAETLRRAIPAMRAEIQNIRFGEAPLKTIGVGLGVLVILVFIGSALSRWVRAPGAEATGQGTELRLALEPSDPYLE